ncbi:hypothetical protein RUM44_013506 [Polyplax serrata]|uniref:Uncharacterized protein n=1 Tax=Polyplax serrata TaxID=468196 RepID=A0ABR1BEC9_POLSC
MHNEEFGEVFERWLGTSELPKLKQNGGVKTCHQLQTSQSNGGEKVKMCNGNQPKRKSRDLRNNELEEISQNSCRTRSLPTKTKNGNVRNYRRLNNMQICTKDKFKDDKEWSDGLMADFEKLIQMELSQLTIETMKEDSKSQDSSGSPNSDSSVSTDSNSSTGSLKRNPRTFRRHFSEGSDGHGNGDAILLRVRPLAEEFQRRGSDSQLPPRRPKRIPSPVRIKDFFRSTSPFGTKGKIEISNNNTAEGKRICKNEMDIDVTTAVPAKRKAHTDRKIPFELQNFLTKIRPLGTRNRSPLRGESPGELSSGFNTMNSSIADAEDSLDAILSSVSTATQTSPALSRSSSFTWMSDCSSSIILNTPGSLSDVNDEKSSSSGRSSSSPARLQCENGCRSECDCATTGSRDSSGESRDSGDTQDTQEDTKKHQKLNRKETWEKIRRRHSELLRLGRKSYSEEVDVWVRRESVYTQTQEDGDTDREVGVEEHLDNVSKWLENDRFSDKPQGLPLRPKEPVDTNVKSLPLDKSRGSRPQHLSIAPLTIRSLPSPTECQNQPSSPSTASLKLVGTPMAPDLGNKSSSAPVIMKQTMALKKDLAKVEEDTKKLVGTGFSGYEAAKVSVGTSSGR